MTGASPPEPLCVRINDAARMRSLGRTKLYDLIAVGELERLSIRLHRIVRSRLLFFRIFRIVR